MLEANCFVSHSFQPRDARLKVIQKLLHHDDIPSVPGDLRGRKFQ
ncbi:MAG: hypothetical protein JWO48_1461 [Bryobacterales bacterium]|nr:hypothetical protein [Bryobacterales bacterium]